MWTQSKTDEMVLHAQNETSEAFSKFLKVYLEDRLPTPEEIAEQLSVPLEDVMMAMVAMAEEGD